MPQLLFKGITVEDVKGLSRLLLDPLANLTDTPRDYFTFECSQTIHFFDGEEVRMYPLIEIVQFDRGYEVESKMANLIQTEVRSLGYKECEVYFTHVEKERYFE